VLSGFWATVSFLMGAALILFVLALVVSYLVTLVQDIRTDEPLDCSKWAPGKMAESPHDLACE
jgi:hypothetical protein